MKGSRFPLPGEKENCHLVDMTEEDKIKVVTSIPKLDTLMLINTLKKHSFEVFNAYCLWSFVENTFLLLGLESVSL